MSNFLVFDIIYIHLKYFYVEHPLKHTNEVHNDLILLPNSDFNKIYFILYYQFLKRKKLILTNIIMNVTDFIISTLSYFYLGFDLFEPHSVISVPCYL